MAVTYAEEAMSRIGVGPVGHAVAFGRGMLESAKGLCALANGARVVMSSAKLQGMGSQGQVAAMTSTHGQNLVFSCSRVKRARAFSRSAQPQLGALVVCSTGTQHKSELLQHTTTNRCVIHRKAAAEPVSDWTLALGLQSSLL